MSSKSVIINPQLIYDISSEATYTAGKTCTVNMAPERTIQALKNDLDECLRIHQMWIHLETNRRGYVSPEE
jgi:hypothetical protein